MAAEYGGRVAVEVVTLKEREGAERYRQLRRAAGRHLPVPCVLIEGTLAAEGIPEQETLRAQVAEALAALAGEGQPPERHASEGRSA